MWLESDKNKHVKDENNEWQNEEEQQQQQQQQKWDPMRNMAKHLLDIIRKFTQIHLWWWLNVRDEVECIIWKLT